jgi:hypothetical protein
MPYLRDIYQYAAYIARMHTSRGWVQGRDGFRPVRRADERRDVLSDGRELAGSGGLLMSAERWPAARRYRSEAAVGVADQAPAAFVDPSVAASAK